MQYYRCKCGKHTAWTSMGVERCRGCETCNTTLEMSPQYHTEPAEHTLVTEYNPRTGAEYQICLKCCQKFESVNPIVESIQWTNHAGNFSDILDLSKGESGYPRIKSASPLLWEQIGVKVDHLTLEVPTERGIELMKHMEWVCLHKDGSLSVSKQEPRSMSGLNPI